MNERRIWEAVIRLTDVLTEEFGDLSPAEHHLVLHLNLAALIDALTAEVHEGAKQ